MTLTWVDKMAVDVRGEGDTIVLIHGLGGSLNAWTSLLPALTRWRCVRMDLPGAGRSVKAYALGEATPHRGHISDQTHADAVLRVFEALNITSAHVVGHSFGTLIAQHVAAKAPQKVKSLSLFGALLEPAPQMRINMQARARLAREGAVFDIAEAVSNASLSASSRENLPVAVAFVREIVGAQDPEGLARNSTALGEAQKARLELIHCPVLIVNGDEDVVTPLVGARDLARQLKNCRVEVFGRCGHWPMIERPLESQRALRDFITSVR